MAVTGNEAVTLSQFRTAIGGGTLSETTSGADGTEAVKLSQLKMLVDNMSSLDFQWTTVVLQGEQYGKLTNFKYATDFDVDITNMICVLHIGSGLPVVYLSSQLSPTLSNTLSIDTVHGDWSIHLKTNTGKVVVDITNNALVSQATISYAAF